MRRLLALLLFVTAAAALAAENPPAQLRLGFQKGSVGIVLTKQRQLLERRFPHTRISYIEFPAGPQLLEALNAGSIDLGPTGDMPPIFAQAAGIDLLYVGAQPQRPEAEVVLVGKRSPIRDVAQLKGHRIALQKGSSSHNLLLQLLRRAGLGITDVQPVYLAPADARAAFASGQVDAWVIWDPYYSAALLDGQARVLADGRGIPGIGVNYYLAARDYAQAHGVFLAQVLDTISQGEALSLSDRAGSVRVLADYSGLPPAVLALFLRHRPPRNPVRPLDPAAIEAQQRIADLFYRERLIPKPLRVAAIVWNPPALAARPPSSESSP